MMISTRRLTRRIADTGKEFGPPSSRSEWALASLGTADGSHLAAVSAPAEELITAIGLEPQHAHSGRHIEALQNLSRSRIDSPQVALVTLPGGVPEISVDPGDTGDEAVGLDGAK